jgi:pilus assembly protein CpaF
MSSLAERLAAARRQAEQAAQGDTPQPGQPPAGRPRGPEPREPRAAAPTAARAPPPRSQHGDGRPAPPGPEVARARIARRGSAEHDRLEELKAGRAHRAAQEQLGPQLYDANLDQAELDQRVRASWDS